MKIRRDLETPMRDGVILRMDVYSPEGEEKVPAILLRTPYGKEHITDDPLYCDFERYTGAGYHVAIQDCRGTGASDGVLKCNGDSEYPDGYDTVEWLAVQPWCDGHVGMFGLSYHGFDQTAAAVTAPPHLDAICPFMTQSIPPYGLSRQQTIGCYHLGWVYGQLLRELEKHIPDPEQRKRLEPVLRDRMAHLDECNFHLPMNENPAATIDGISMFREYLDVVNHCEDPDFWRSVGRPAEMDRLGCAVFHATGWFDGMKDTTVDNYQAVRDQGSEYAKANNRLLIGPWAHGGHMGAAYDGMNFGDSNTGKAQDVAGMMIRWFDRYLKKRKGLPEESRVRYFIMGANEWREDSDWPPTAASLKACYLDAGGRLTEAVPETAGKDRYDYDPNHPMPSFLKDSRGHFLIPDWSEMTKDCGHLTYETEPLEHPVTIAGCVEMRLYAVTDAKDTDFSCRISDVYPDGFEFEMAAGIVRARHRSGVLFQTDETKPGQVTRYDFRVGSTARRIEAGHRIKITVASSLYPAHDRNLNTGAVPGQTSEMVTAHQIIYRGGEQASCVLLPVLAKQE